MRGDSAGSLLALDRSHVWHPYDSMPALREPLLVESASGVRLQLARPVAGRIELIDGMSSWWSAIHGYRHLVLDTALRDQVSRMSHVMFGGLTHEPAIRLCARLSAIAPPGLARVFLCDSGSVAVEVAMKMALQYQRAVGRANRTRFLTWRGGYHGDTFLAMSVCDPVGGMHGLWTDLLPAQVFADVPPAGHDAAVSAEYVRHLEEIAGRSRDSLAGVIVEPVVQGAGGMRFHNPAYLGVLRRLADAHGLPLIFDEIATGFGRTGTLFAAERAGVAPDIMCVGKGMTGGYVSMAAALCTDEIASGISAGEVPVLAHGPTFMGNPLAAAVAGASIDLLLSSDWAGAVARIERELRTGLEEARTLPAVVDVRTLGAIGVIELAHPVDVAAAAERAAGEGVWLRPFRNLVYAMPPFVSGPEEVAAIARAMVAAATT